MDLWARLTALEPSVPADQWQTAVDAPAPQDLLEEASDGYHDRPRGLEAFAEVSKAPEGKRIKNGTGEDIELALLERVAVVVVAAADQGIVLSAPRVITLLRA